MPEATVLDSKRARLEKLYSNYNSEFKGNDIVPGSGDVNCRLMLVGEAPGKDEVRLGIPFAGAAGKNLDKFLNMLGVERESLYITNAIKYRLSKTSSTTGKVVNRPAKRQDIIGSGAYLQEEIKIIEPLLITTLGNVPLRMLTGEPQLTIGEMHGRLNALDLLGKSYSIFPLYHPASIIYNPSLRQAYEKDINKLKLIMESYE